MATTAELKIKCLLELTVPVVAVVITHDRQLSVICRSQEDAEKISRFFRLAQLRSIKTKQRLDGFDGQRFWQADAVGTIQEIQQLERAA